MDLPELDDYQALLCTDTPLLDVRAPVEYVQGAFPCSVNHPLLNDEERKQIGISYKHQGHDAAVALGAKLVAGDVKAARIAHWQQFVETHPTGVLYCCRGGMRSKIAQQWIYEQTGKVIPRVKGGYKALRRYLIEQTDQLAAKMDMLILSGRTGTGKTLVIKRLKQALDLEALANHRGSSIGRQISPQPTQIEFEINVAIALLKLHQQGISKMVLEDESPNIGSVHIPHSLYAQMREAPCVVLKAPLDRRLDITLKEYVSDMMPQYIARAASEAQGFGAFSAYLYDSLERVSRRLGQQRYGEIRSLMEAALNQQQSHASDEMHRQWLSRMLVEYYDPMYDYQQKKRQRIIKHEAGFDETMNYLQDYQ